MNDEQIALLSNEELVDALIGATRRLDCRDPPDLRVAVLETAAPVLKKWLENENIGVDFDTINAMWSLVDAAEG